MYQFAVPTLPTDTAESITAVFTHGKPFRHRWELVLITKRIERRRSIVFFI
jgi:hypothetical protein